MSDRAKFRLYVVVFWILLVPLLLTGNWMAVVVALAFFLLGTLVGIAVWREYQTAQFRQVQHMDIALWRAEKKAPPTRSVGQQKGSQS